MNVLETISKRKLFEILHPANVTLKMFTFTSTSFTTTRVCSSTRSKVSFHFFKYFECHRSKNVYRMITVPSQTHFMYHFTYTEMAEWRKWFGFGREKRKTMKIYESTRRRRERKLDVIRNAFSFHDDWKFGFSSWLSLFVEVSCSSTWLCWIYFFYVKMFALQIISFSVFFALEFQEIVELEQA